MKISILSRALHLYLLICGNWIASTERHVIDVTLFQNFKVIPRYNRFISKDRTTDSLWTSNNKNERTMKKVSLTSTSIFTNSDGGKWIPQTCVAHFLYEKFAKSIALKCCSICSLYFHLWTNNGCTLIYVEAFKSNPLSMTKSD